MRALTPAPFSQPCIPVSKAGSLALAPIGGIPTIQTKNRLEFSPILAKTSVASGPPCRGEAKTLISALGWLSQIAPACNSHNAEQDGQDMCLGRHGFFAHENTQ